MKLHLILAVLGAIPYAAAEVAADAEVAAKAPYNDEFNKLCPNSEQTKGSFCVGGETWTYHCNTQQARQEGWWRFRASTPEACASACAANPDECDKPDWVKSDGYCWIGKVRDSPTHSPGIIAFEKKSSGCEGGQCTLAEPVCPKNDLKPAEVGGKNFMMTCNRHFDGTKKQSGSFPEQKDCIKACANKSDCTYITYGINSKTCWMGTGNYLDRKSYTHKTWQSAVKIN